MEQVKSGKSLVVILTRIKDLEASQGEAVFQRIFTWLLS